MRLYPSRTKRANNIIKPNLPKLSDRWCTSSGQQQPRRHMVPVSRKIGAFWESAGQWVRLSLRLWNSLLNFKFRTYSRAILCWSAKLVQWINPMAKWTSLFISSLTFQTGKHRLLPTYCSSPNLSDCLSLAATWANSEAIPQFSLQMVMIIDFE